MSVRLWAGNSWHSRKGLSGKNVNERTLQRDKGLEEMVRHLEMSNRRKLLTLLHLKGQGEEWSYQSAVPAGAEEEAPLGRSCGPRGTQPRLSREGMGE